MTSASFCHLDRPRPGNAAGGLRTDGARRHPARIVRRLVGQSPNLFFPDQLIWPRNTHTGRRAVSCPTEGWEEAGRCRGARMVDLDIPGRRCPDSGCDLGSQPAELAPQVHAYDVAQVEAVVGPEGQGGLAGPDGGGDAVHLWVISRGSGRAGCGRDGGRVPGSSAVMNSGGAFWPAAGPIGFLPRAGGRAAGSAGRAASGRG